VTTLTGPSRSPSSGGAPTSLVVLLHGRGSNGDDLIGLADAISAHYPDTAFHAPNAPHSVGGFGFQWFEVNGLESREPGLRETAPVVNGFIDELLEQYGLPASKCALMGFSQGTITSIHVAPRRADQLAGVVGFSGAMFSGGSLADEMQSKPPFILIHGDDDMVLDSRETELAAKRFEEVGVPVTMHILPGLPHSIDQRGMTLAVEFLDRVLV
jgi:phospholipase/carboxylesterase